jgi:hypothetical protein
MQRTAMLNHERCLFTHSEGAADLQQVAESRGSTARRRGKKPVLPTGEQKHERTNVTVDKNYDE